MKKRKKYLALGVAALGLIAVLANPGCASTRRTGWVEENGQHYYYNERGRMVTGWLSRDDGSYYLLEDGVRAAGWQEIDGSTYFFDDSGRMCTGLTPIDGVTYAFGSDGILASGWLELGGKTHYIAENGTPLTGWQEIEGKAYYLDADGSLYNGWLEDDGHTYYLQSGLYATGIVRLDDTNHFFDSRGWRVCMVNPWNALPPDTDAVEVVSVGGDHAIAVEAKADFSAMVYAMQQADLGPIITSSFRTGERQQEIFNERMAGYISQGMSEADAYAKTATSVAIPGTSEHQLGLAMDMTDAHYNKLDEGQMETPTQLWLIENSWRYGFILRYPAGKQAITGIIYEPWHYRYVGKELAAELYELGLTMEEYFDTLTADKSLTASNPENGNTAH